MNILILSKKRAREFSWEKPWACISISSPNGGHPELSDKNRQDVLRMTFYDTEYLYPGLDEEYMFNESHAKEVWDFVKKNEDVDLLMIHCEAGMSRSPGVGAAIAKKLWDDDERIFRNYTPNMKIYRTMLESNQEV